ncbi:tryptophan dimethylallyltransferase family protein [Amycolatopsis pithecellobii]|uniref:Prenyltransferase n=1 Tax=Amycolatopsis pithecellobii TaxID=664692 RepID=A0A6N7YYC7_9PSEU|nr:tryptophan dimethylallyltransferase family protein [Amycolatopsis pithecellobii]MTD56908.1 hypothetical protein [Amycolatopsis pithecellobii]
MRTWANARPAALTYREVVAAHLEVLTEFIDPAAGTASQLDLVGSVLGEWADEPVSRWDQHHSFAANDGSPVEFSFAMSRCAAEARLLFEPLDPTRPATSQAGHQFIARLDDVGVDVSRFRRVEDLFAGPWSGPFSMLCSAALKATGSPLFKVYLNPTVGGRAPQEVVEAAMSRLGLGAPWSRVAAQLGGFGLPSKEIALFALDLGHSSDARVKVYLRHTACGPEAVERVAELADDHQPDLFAKILGRLYGGSAGSLAKAPMTCLSFQGNRPASVTLYCPLDPNVGNDLEASARVVDLLEMAGIAPELFSALATAISGPDLARGRRLSWLSYKRPADPVVTIYAGLDGPQAT